ncbi:Spo0E like sporulation regulatory protein [Marininema mesophilum]|uniref:Spo0E like sporulation regulatory protein n=1 Tax=Marininema mesophilum TaxID=1048340 RepID=A0A1H2ZV71_9BACL|nr:Spo0E like sporulation regulatory protein [Marininema mesophilum]
MERDHLKQKIERVRRQMETKARELGFTHPTVVGISQQLDELLNEWYRGEAMKNQGIYIIRRYTSTIREVAIGRA